ncbi:MAG TPA: hypothetical protein VE130_12920 [Nitrososphaeraceae archaeon]|jgi:predicted negative regulator of RcsB-dependent stress response|nr:hypothetical protein [Nitrososphaeraceae archaeon]
MGLFTLILIVVVILAVIGLGWKTFSSGVISGFETALDVGQPIVKNLTQEARKYVNSADMTISLFGHQPDSRHSI